MRKIVLLVFICIAMCPINGSAQEASVKDKEEKENSNFTFGNISPIILDQGKWEATVVSTLSSFWITNSFGNRTIDRYRVSRNDNFFNLNYGISANKRIDIGLQMRYGRIRLDEDARSSPFKIFSKEILSGFQYSGIATIGGRIRIQPFSGIPNLTLVNTFSVPVLKDKEVQKLLNADRLQNDFIASYYAPLSKSDYIFLQSRYTLQFSNNNNSTSTHFPGISGFYVKSLIPYKWYLYPGLSMTSSYEQYVKGGHLNNTGKYVFTALGSQFQFGEKVGVFAYAQYPLYYKSATDLYTRLIKNSYSDFSLGIRASF